MASYAQLRYVGAYVLAVATLLTVIVPALMKCINEVETAEKLYEAERFADGRLESKPNPA